VIITSVFTWSTLSLTTCLNYNVGWTYCVISGIEQQHQISSNTSPCYDRQAARSMSSSCVTEWRSSQSTWNVWHHIQVYRYAAIGSWPVHVWCRSFSTARLRCYECSSIIAVPLWSALCRSSTAYQTSFDWIDYGTSTRSGRWIWTLSQVSCNSELDYNS